MAQKKSQTISSPLVSAFNNIVNVKRSGSSMQSTQRSYQSFLQFMDVEIRNIEAIPLPKKKDVNKLANLNVASTFGSAGSLLSSLASGALDAAGLIGNFFGGGRKGGTKPNPKAGGPIPKGKGIRLGGFRALGIANTVLAGLDFAQGLQEGEGVGKAASGAGGALAGSLIGGAIGQALIPVPGLGFVVGSMAGNFLGGFAADRAYETVTGQGGLEEKTKQRLKAKEQEQRSKATSLTTLTLPQVLDKFEGVVTKFEKASPGSDSESGSRSMEEGFSEKSREGGDTNPPPASTEKYDGPVTKDTFFPLPKGIISNRSVGVEGGEYGAKRNYGGHSGQDIGGLPPGSPVVAWKTGKVRYTGSVESGDTIMTLDHGGGEQSVYKHVVPTVAAGTVVYGGQQIAKLFAARAYPEHLHFEVWKGGSHTNPNGALSATQKISSPMDVAKAKEQSEKSSGTKSQSASAGGLGKPTIVLAGGTNDYSNPATAKTNIMNSIKDLQSKGYNVVVVPPNESGKFAEVSKAVQEAASSSGATIEKGKYDSSDPLHLQMSEASRIKGKYGNAQVIGDSNAVRIAGGSMQNVAGQRVVGAGTGSILKFAQSMKTASPTAQSQIASSQRQSEVQGVSQQQVSAQQVQQYPTYNQQQSSTTIIPITSSGGGEQRPMVISGGGGGGQTIVMPSAPIGMVLNSLMRSMLLTNLSGT